MKRLQLELTRKGDGSQLRLEVISTALQVGTMTDTIELLNGILKKVERDITHKANNQPIDLSNWTVNRLEFGEQVQLIPGKDS